MKLLLDENLSDRIIHRIIDLYPNSEHVKTLESIMKNTSKTDWARIDAMSDDEIDTSDIPLLTDEFFSKAKLRMPSSSFK